MKTQSSALEQWKIRIMDVIANAQVKRFLSNLGTVFLFRIGAAGLNALSLVIAARYYGVVAVGDINLIMSAAFFLIIPMMIGVQFSIIKFYPVGSQEDKEKLIGTSLFWNILMVVICSLIYLIPGNMFASWLNISPAVWLWGVLFAIAVNFSTVFDAILRAEEKFFLLGLGRLVGTVIFFIIVVLACLQAISFYAFIVALIVNHVVFTIMAYRGMSIRKFRFSWKSTKQIYSYGSMNMVSLALSMTLFTTDLFIVNYFYSGYDVGIYSVYMVNVRMFFNLLFHEIFAVVFLPTVAQLDKLKIYHRIMKMSPLLVPAAILANAALCISLLILFGKDYPLDWGYVALVSVGTGIHFLYWVLNNLFTVEGKKGALINLKVLGIPLIFLLAMAVYLTREFGIVGAMSASLATQIILVAVFAIVIQREYGKKSSASETNAASI